MNLTEAAKRLKPAGKIPRAILVTDSERLPRPDADLLESLPRGAGILIRHRETEGRRLLARSVQSYCRSHGVLMIVSDDWRLAATMGAAGIHLPERTARHTCLAAALGWARRRKALVTMACHSRAALAHARRIGVTVAILSPLFPTASHPGQPVIGLTRWRLWVREGGLPVVALGGITGKSCQSLLNTQAVGLAAISGWNKKKGTA